MKFALVHMRSETLVFSDIERINSEYKTDQYYSKIHYLLIILDDKCTPKIKLKDLNKLSELYNTEPQKNNHKNIVWLVSKPIVTALAQMFIIRTKDNSMYCSTIEKAYELLNLPIKEDEFIQLTGYSK